MCLAGAVACAVMAPDELLGVTEIAELLNVTRRTATRYAQRADFPPPLDTLARGRVWRRVDVVKWRDELGPPLPVGRPKKHS